MLAPCSKFGVEERGEGGIEGFEGPTILVLEKKGRSFDFDLDFGGLGEKGRLGGMEGESRRERNIGNG